MSHESARDDSALDRLLRQARTGDDRARNELFGRCRAYVDVVARAQVESWLRTKVDASDLVQQTLLDAHRGFDEFQGGTRGEWMAWLRRIVQTNALDFARRYGAAQKRRAGRERPLDAARRGADGSTFLARDPQDPGESPSQHVLRKERELEVAAAIERLPEDYREVIHLRNLQRLPFDEVARRMDRSRPAAQMLWMRALKKLESLLAESPSEREDVAT